MSDRHKAKETADTIVFVLASSEKTPAREAVLSYLYDRLGIELGYKEWKKVA